MSGRFTPGPWKWTGLANHVLNATHQTEDGSSMDHSSGVMMLSAAARWHLKPGDAAIIESAPMMYEVLNAILTIMQSDGDQVANLIAAWEDIEQDIVSAISSIDAEKLQERGCLDGG